MSWIRKLRARGILRKEGICPIHLQYIHLHSGWMDDPDLPRLACDACFAVKKAESVERKRQESERKKLRLEWARSVVQEEKGSSE